MGGIRDWRRGEDSVLHVCQLCLAESGHERYHHKEFLGRDLGDIANH